MPESPYGRVLERLAAARRRRSLRPRGPAGGGRAAFGGQTLVDFSSNDYLGLSRHPELVRRAQDWAAKWGAGAGASRLVTGEIAPFAAIEAKVAAGKGSEAALVLACGFQANATVLPALLDREAAGPGPLVFSDRLNHASIHAGCRAAGVRQIRFRHRDLGHLEKLLKARAGERAMRLIVSETVFSMDGDAADVDGLAALAERFGAWLYLDDAHATGVLGADGFGLAAGRAAPRHVVMGTFGKALGGFGAYVACTAELREYLVNRCAGFVYSTALPPPVLGAMDAALDLVPRLEPERARLHDNAARLRAGLGAAGLDTGESSTHIVPVLLGAEDAALDFARSLEEDDGILAVAIRPPTVPPGMARVRFSVSAAHSTDDIERLIAAAARHAPRAAAKTREAAV